MILYHINNMKTKCQVSNCNRPAEETRLEKISDIGNDRTFEIKTSLCCCHGNVISNQETAVNWIFT